jgi:putative ABC transport system permease protein
MSNFHLALRLAARQRGFTLLVVLMLALGIGGATAMFSVIRAVLLKPLPYDEPDKLVWMFGAFSLNDSAAVSPPDFLDYRARNSVFDPLGAMMIAPQAVTVVRAAGPERLNAASVSAGLITTLGVAPELGRDFHRDEERQGVAALIISHRLWRDQFDGTPDVLGRTMRVDGQVHTIVGVMPAGFALPFDPFIRLTDPVDVYLPIAFDGEEARVRRFHFLRVIGRLKPGVSIASAQSAMDVIARQLEAAYPENETWKLRLLPLHERLVGNLKRVLRVLMAAVILLLLVACANVAGLLLARGVLRQPELAVRVSLGASRRRVFAQLLVEALVLAGLGGVAGLLLASWLVQVLKSLGPPDLPRLAAIAVDPFVVVFAGLLGAGTSLVFGVAPALQATRINPAESLRGGLRVPGGRSQTRLRNGMVLFQVALSCTLLISAGLLVRSLWRLQSVDTGFVAKNVVLAHISLPPDKYTTDEALAAWFEMLQERVSASRGVEAAAVSSAPPLTGANDTAVHREGRPPASDGERRFAQLRFVGDDYFAALGIPVQAGRAFTTADRTGTQAVVVISRRMAEELFPDERPVGERLIIDLGQQTAAEIVGIVGDARLFGQASEAPATMYLSARQTPRPSTHLVVRMTRDPEGAGELLRTVVRSLDPTVAIDRTRALEALLGESLAQPRFRTVLVATFAAVALALTLCGLYGTLAWVVAQRKHEFGVRVALGAAPRELRRLVLGEGVRIMGPGALTGLAGGLAAGRLIRDLLYDVTPFEPDVVATVIVGLLALGLVAMIGPARQAARVDPASVLRTD